MNNSSLQQVFIEEAIEIFGSLENDLIALETVPDDEEMVNKIFRSMHTLKGSGSMFGFTNLAKFAHELETLFEAVRNNIVRVNQKIISVSLESLDFMRTLLNDHDVPERERELLLTVEIRELMPDTADTGSNAKPATVEAPVPKGPKSVYKIDFRPERDVLIKGINPVVILKNLEQLGEYFIFTHEEDVPELHKMDPEMCYFSWTIILISTHPPEAIHEVFIFVEDCASLTIDELFHNIQELESEKIPFLGEILHSRGDITTEDIEKIIERKPLFGERAVELGITTKEKVESALFEQQAIKTLKSNIVSHTAASTIRVNHDKLDILTNAVSELVTLQARLTQFSESEKSSELSSIAEYLEKLTSSLRDTVMVIRMVPVDDGFSSMHRLVRDLANGLGKKVKLTIEGGDTELDKAIIDNLKDPMMHLIRNSIDHGLESPAERVKLGKPEHGTITIRAEHSGAHVNISVHDDGSGLDVDKIRSRAVSRGLIAKDDVLSEKETLQLIFQPGFSTAEQTTDISGRGVGMDVVKRNIEMIRGEVLLDSTPGAGTTIRMKLPITLAIIDGLLFTVGDELFVLNIATVSECLELTDEIRTAAGERNILKLRDDIVPFVFLRDLLNIPGDSPEHEQIIITHTHDQTLGLVVDTVVGKHQTVVKSTGRLFSNVREVNGATILGDGRIALILDVNTLTQNISELQACETV